VLITFFLIIIYVVVMFVFLLAGISLVFDNAEYGKDDEEFKQGRYILKTWIIWPYCLYRIVKMKIKEAEEVE